MDLNTALIPWAAGTFVGSNTLLTRIARDEVSETWLARGTGLAGFQQLVVLHRESAVAPPPPECAQAFLLAAGAAAQVEHSNVARLHGAGVQAGIPFAVEELLLGESLESVLRAGERSGKRIPLHIAVQLMAYAARGLNAIHQKQDKDFKALGLAHGDVSSDSVFVTYAGAVKLRNRGLPLLRASAPAPSPKTSVERQAADLFALGTVFYEAVGRGRLFGGDTDATGAPVTAHPALPSSLGAIVLKALAASPQEGFANVREFQLTLEKWLDGEGGLPGTGAIAAYLRELFADRAAERARLVDALRRGESVDGLARRWGQEASIPAKVPAPVLVRPTPVIPIQEPSPAPPAQILPVAPPAPVLPVAPPPAALPASVLAPPAPIVPIRRPPSTALAPLLPLAPLTPTPTPRLDWRTRALTGAVAAARIRPLRPAIVGVAVLAGLFFVGHRLFRSSPAPAPDARPLHSAPPKPVPITQRPSRSTSPAPVAHSRPAKTIAAPAPQKPGPTAVATPRPPESRPPPAIPKPPPPKVAAAPVAAPAPRPPLPDGSLTFDTNPWTEVFLGGQKLGDTPLVELSLPAGRHVLRVLNSEKGIDRKVEVIVPPGANTVKSVELGDEK